MNTSKQLTENQQKAIDIIRKLVEDKKIEFVDAFQLMLTIFDSEKEFVYIPYQTPHIEPYQPWKTEPLTTPWWEENKIICDKHMNSVTTDPTKSPLLYATYNNGFTWTTNSLME